MTGGDVTQADIVDGLRRLGIRDGDTVFFHSSLKSLGRVAGGAEEVIAGFRAAVGAEGTVVVPTFTLVGRVGPFGSWYDHATSPSTVGLITETLRAQPDAVRSFHPVHSVAAIGRRALAITAGHRLASGRISPWCDAAFAHDSPLDLLVRWNAWYVLLGVTFHVQTLMHYVEAILADAVLRRASESDRVRLRDGVRRWGRPGVWPSLNRIGLGELLRDRQVYEKLSIGQADAFGARCRPLLLETLKLILSDPERWLNEPFRVWMGEPLEPDTIFATYALSGGAPPLGAPHAEITCEGQVHS